MFTAVPTCVCVPAPHLDHVLGAGPQRVQLRLAVPHPAGQLGRGHVHLAPVLSINCLETTMMDKRFIIIMIIPHTHEQSIKNQYEMIIKTD